MGQVPAPRHRALGEKERRPRPAEAGGRLLAEGRWGWGRGSPAQQAPQEGPRPFLSVLPTAQSSCACAKGKLQLSKTKTPKEELPQWPWKAAGPHPLHRATRADSQAAGRHDGSLLCCHPGACGLPCSRGWEAKPPGLQLGWGQEDGLRVPLPPQPGPGQLDKWREVHGDSIVLTQLLREDLLKGHLTSVLQVLLHDTADAERQGTR